MESWVVGARTRACLQSSRRARSNRSVPLRVSLLSSSSSLSPRRGERAETRKLRDRRLSAHSEFQRRALVVEFPNMGDLWLLRGAFGILIRAALAVHRGASVLGASPRDKC